MSGPNPNDPSIYAFQKCCNKCKKIFVLKDMSPPRFTYCRLCNKKISLDKFHKVRHDKQRYEHLKELQRKRYHSRGWLDKSRHRANTSARREGVEGTLLREDCRKIFERDRICVYCGSKERLTFDHVRPKSIGGKNVFSNIVMACHSCNTKKGAADALDWCQVRLKQIPGVVKEVYYLNYPEKRGLRIDV